jgi:hypothetical protein
VHVENFTINHQTSDPSQLPGFPADWKPYFGPGRGGVMFLGKVKSDPSCQPGPGSGPNPYVDPGKFSPPGKSSPHAGGSAGGGSAGGSAGKGAPAASGKARAAVCRRLRGSARRGLGKARLGRSRASLVKALGPPSRRAHGFLHFCARPGRDLAVHFNRRGRADFAVSTAKTFHSGRARVGARLGAARLALRGDRVLARRGGNYLLAVNHPGWRLLVGVRRKRVSFLAAASSGLSTRRLATLLASSG